MKFWFANQISSSRGTIVHWNYSLPPTFRSLLWRHQRWIVDYLDCDGGFDSRPHSHGAHVHPVREMSEETRILHQRLTAVKWKKNCSNMWADFVTTTGGAHPPPTVQIFNNIQKWKGDDVGICVQRMTTDEAQLSFSQANFYCNFYFARKPTENLLIIEWKGKKTTLPWSSWTWSAKFTIFQVIWFADEENFSLHKSYL